VNRKSIRLIVPLMIVIAAAFWFFQQQKGRSKPEKAEFQVRVPVSISLVDKASIRDSFAVVGVSEAFRDVEVYSEVAGLVRKVTAEVGQKKNAGAVLLKVDDELQASAWRKARAAHEQAKLDLRRYGNLHREGAVALSSFEGAKLRFEDAEAEMIAARRRYQDTGIKSPIAGTVTSRLVDVGEMVQPGMKVANVVDVSKVRIKVAVPEKLVVRLAEGEEVRVTTDVYPGRTFQGAVSTISGKAARDHTYEVEVVMDNPAETPFRAGMFTRIAFVDRTLREALILPRQALVGSIREPKVFLVRNGKATLRTIVVGQELQNTLEVLEGLAPGDSVVTSGQNELGEGTPVSVMKSANPAGR